MRKELEEYCKLDTLAEYEIIEGLKRELKEIDEVDEEGEVGE